jgi:serine/threonine protein kinase/tetratricopeptide (TPR) repeat protein
MNVQQDKAKSVLLNALEIGTASARRAYLDAECAGNEALRREVQDLLDHHDQMGVFLDSPAPALAATTEEPLTERPGAVIGPYKLMEQIGEGGMGLVFVAEQQHPVRRKVALKVLKPGMDTRQVVARFEAERQALAIMDHPNIAKVHDGGETASGRPYFVMELVKGTPITAFCDQNQLTPRQRLELFGSVCQAVQHAHQKGIIHRDLKPSNVLVSRHDTTRIVKVIDFGVAKALGQELTDKTLFTGIAQMIGTPLYMSPEQAGMSDLDIDTRSDIYSLGVLLYELLTGTTPFDKERLKEVGFDELRRIIREEEPPKPSTRISTLGQAATTASTNRKSDPRELSRLIRGELDWIVMKCLEKDRNRRYQSASSLAADVQRYLADEPVTACPPSAGYRLRKFARRNRVPVLAGALVLAALLAGIVGTSIGLVQARRAERHASEARDDEAMERHNAEAAQEQAMDALRATTDEVVEKLLGAKPALGPTEIEFLESTLKRWQTFAAQQGKSELARRARAEGARRVAYLGHTLGHNDAARAGYHDAIAGYAQLAADYPTVPQYRLELAKSHNSLGILLKDLGQHAEAEAAWRHALAIQEKLAADYPAVPRYRLDLASSHNNLGTLLADLDQRAEAEAAYRQALAIQEKLAADYPLPLYRMALATSHNNLGNLLAGLGQHAEAEAAYRQALAIQEKLAADYAAVPLYRMELATSHYNLGNLLAGLGKNAEAEAAFRQALAIEEKLAADYPAVPQYRLELAKSHNNLGNLLVGLGQHAQAEAAYRQGLAIREKLAAEYPAVPQYRLDLASSRHNLGSLLANLGQHAEAEAAYRQALAVHEKLAADYPAVPQYRLRLAQTHNNLGKFLRHLGKRAEAEVACRQALAIHQALAADNAAPQNRLDLASSHNSLGVLLAGLGKRAEAETAYRQALAILQKLAADHPAVPDYRMEMAISHNILGILLNGLGKRAEAEAVYRQALATQEKLADDYPVVPRYRLGLAESHHNLANLLTGLGQHAEAESAYRRALAIHQKLAADYPAVPLYRLDLASSHNSLGILLAGLGQHTEAEAVYRQALAIKEKLAADYPAVPQYRLALASSHNNLGILLVGLGKRAEAEAAYRQALTIREELAANFPAVPSYRTELGGSQCNFGNLLLAKKEPEQALPWYARAIATLEDVLRQFKVDVTAQQYLRNAHWGRAEALDGLKRHAEAALAWDKAIELSRDAQQAGLRLQRALSRVRAGQVEAAIQEAKELAKNANAETLYNAARILALGASRPDESAGSLSKEECAQHAVALLRQAVAKSYKNAEQMKKDDDLKALRQREDFQDLLAELEAKPKK